MSDSEYLYLTTRLTVFELTVLKSNPDLIKDYFMLLEGALNELPSIPFQEDSGKNQVELSADLIDSLNKHKNYLNQALKRFL